MQNLGLWHSCRKWAISYICVLQLIMRSAITLWIQPVNQWEMKRTVLNYHQCLLHLNCLKRTLVCDTQNAKQQYRNCRTQIILSYSSFPFHSIHSIYGATTLLGHGLPRKTLPFFSIFCSSPPLLFSWDLLCATHDDVRPHCSWFSHSILQAQQNTERHVETKIAFDWLSSF
jgi:hypothetical protein